MKIKILNVRNERYVEFSSSFGSGIATCANIEWVEKGKMYYGAELDLDPPIKLNQNAVLVSDQRCFMRFVGDKNELQGFIEAIDEDKVGYLRMAADCLIIIEIESNEIKTGDYLLMTVNVDDFRVTLM